MKRTMPSTLAILALAAIPAVAAAGETTFQVRIENVSTTTLLKTSKGDVPVGVSPGLWVVHRGAHSPIFKSGSKDFGKGLEAQSEDGNPAMLAASLGDLTHGVFDTPVGDTKPGPATPGKAFAFTFTAQPGDRLCVTTMMGQSNDWFYAPDDKGIALFDGTGKPIAGDLTSRFRLWNAGTELDEEPGAGPNQGPRQPAPNTGPSESKPVTLVHSQWAVPPTAAVLRVTVTPKAMATATR